MAIDGTASAALITCSIEPNSKIVVEVQRGALTAPPAIRLLKRADQNRGGAGRTLPQGRRHRALTSPADRDEPRGDGADQRGRGYEGKNDAVGDRPLPQEIEQTRRAGSRLRLC
jgi:hypothetical protein